jgi:hypothetical protein
VLCFSLTFFYLLFLFLFPSFDKANNFVRELFGRWSALDTNHSLTIIMFSRTFYAPGTPLSPQLLDLPVDEEGKRYQDFFKVVVNDETKLTCELLIELLKKEFLQYSASVDWLPPVFRQRNILLLILPVLLVLVLVLVLTSFLFHSGEHRTRTQFNCSPGSNSRGSQLSSERYRIGELSKIYLYLSRFSLSLTSHQSSANTYHLLLCCYLLL